MPYDRRVHGPRRVVGPGFHSRVYRLVRRVPPGFVTTYGDLASALGLKSAARHVGYALAALPPERDDVPWHRVVNGRGRLSPPDDARQTALLAAEGVRLSEDGCIIGFAEVRLPAEVLDGTS